MTVGSPHQSIEQVTDYKGREMLGCPQRVLQLPNHVNQFSRRRRDKRREGVGCQLCHVLNTVQWTEHGCHFGQLETVHIHVDVQQDDPFEDGLLIV